MQELLGQRYLADLPSCHSNGEQHVRSDLAQRDESDQRQRTRYFLSRDCCFAVALSVRGGVLEVQTASIERHQTQLSEPRPLGRSLGDWPRYPLEQFPYRFYPEPHSSLADRRSACDQLCP